MALVPVVPAAVARAAAARAAGGAGAAAVRDPPAWAAMGAQERFARAFLTLRSTFGGAAALGFWARAADAAMPPKKGAATAAAAPPLTEKAMRAAFVAAWGDAAKSAETKKGKVAAKKGGADAWTDLAAGAGYSSEAGMALAELSAFALRRGLAQAGR